MGRNFEDGTIQGMVIAAKMMLDRGHDALAREILDAAEVDQMELSEFTRAHAPMIRAFQRERNSVIEKPMTPEDLAKALKLYKQYKCDTLAYRNIAAKYGMQTTDLNQRCWREVDAQRQVEQKRKA